MNTTPTLTPLAAFAPLFAEPAGSPIRELFPLLSRPGMMSLAGGYPSASLLDAEGLAQAASHALGQGISALQYGATEGLPAMRDALAQQAQARGMSASAPDVLVTTGSQQAFDLLVRVLLQPGDTALVEVPAYPATLQTLRLAQANIVGVPMDADGLHTAALAELLAQMPAAQRPKLLYTVPNFSNPRGSLLSAQRRQALVQLALQYGFWIVEDDPYGELHFAHAQDTGSGTPATLRSMAAHLAPAVRNPVVYLSSLSKTVAPALRIGWMLADQALLRRCAVAKQTVDLCTSPMAQRACAEYQRRMHALLQGLNAIPDQPLRCTMPAGGMFVWADIAPHIAPQRLFEAAVEHGVLYVPGKAFYPDAADRHALRLSFAATEAQDMAEAVQRLGRAALQAQSA
jgi:DNA-binding transcriptional MocR family regulator